MEDNDFERQRKKQELSRGISLKIDEEAQDLFKSETLARKTMSNAGRTILILGIVLFLIVIISLFFLPYGAISNFLTGWELPQFNYSLSDYRDLIIYRFSNFFAFFTGNGTGTFSTVFFSFMIVILAGCAMACSGSVYQGVFSNPMASPTTIGVQAGGMLGGLFYIMFFYDTSAYGNSLVTDSGTYTATSANELLSYWQSQSFFERCGQQFFTMAGCFFGVALIMGISYIAGRGKVSTVGLMLAGSIFAGLISEAGSLLQYYLTYYGDDELRADAVSTLIGGNYIGSSFTWYEFVFMAVPIGICMVIVFLMTERLNIMTFGSDEARSLGVNVNTSRNILIICCTIMTAVVISFCGQVAMVGFMAPHFARYLVGPDFKKLVPASVLLGGVTTLLIYDVCYICAQTGRFNLYTGIVCSAMSLYFMLVYRRRRNADWA